MPEPAPRSLALTRAERERLARVFGDLLPDTTADEREPGKAAGRERDAELRRDVPPHHG